MSRAGISPSADLLSTTELLSSRSSAQSRSGAGRPRAVRWALWLLVGIAFGVLAGFVAGLSRPQPAVGRTGFDQRFSTDHPTGTDDVDGTGE